jgi:dephospho-CoA kinase
MASQRRPSIDRSHVPRERKPYVRRPRGPWKHGAIPVIGLVGGIGAGKSSVATAFAAQGAFVLNADAIGHALLEQRPAFEDVVKRFGTGVIIPGDAERPARVDRAKLASRVFANPAELKALERILHPRMRSTFTKAIGRTIRRGEHRAVVLDAAVLFEAGWDDLCDLVVFVDAPPALRLGRIGETRGWDAATLEARERAPLPLEVKQQRSGELILNIGDLDTLAAEVSRVLRDLKPPRRLPRSESPPEPPREVRSGKAFPAPSRPKKRFRSSS